MGGPGARRERRDTLARGRHAPVPVKKELQMDDSAGAAAGEIRDDWCGPLGADSWASRN
jgi:hypothetical protein